MPLYLIQNLRGLTGCAHVALRTLRLLLNDAFTDWEQMQDIVNGILSLADEIRYAAIYADGVLHSQQKADLPLSSSSESDKYEEWLVNPAILTLATQRGNLDCGGTEYVLIRYGNFFQFIMNLPNGHVSVCIQPDSDVLQISQKIQNYVDSLYA